MIPAYVSSTAVCNACRNLRHVQQPDGTFVRCPECYVKRYVQRELQVRQYPAAWAALDPKLVIQMFDAGSAVGQAMQGLLNGSKRLVHAYGLPTDRRQAFVGTLTYGFLEKELGAQVLDSADLAMRHFTKDASQWSSIERKREAVLFTLGREVENRLGFFYLRSLLDRAVNFRLPFVLVTDYALEVHAPRYPDLLAVIESAQFDVTNLALAK